MNEVVASTAPRRVGLARPHSRYFAKTRHATAAPWRLARKMVSGHTGVMGARPPEQQRVRPQDVRALRQWLLMHLRQGSTNRHPEDAPEAIAELAGTASFARLRSGLAWFAVRNRAAAQLSYDDIALWIDTAGLRGMRTSVTQIAKELGLSARQVHRRIRHVDVQVAQLLSTLQPTRLEDWAPAEQEAPVST